MKKAKEGWRNKGKYKQDGRECGWEREAMRRGTKRQREWSILEP